MAGNGGKGGGGGLAAAINLNDFREMLRALSRRATDASRGVPDCAAAGLDLDNLLDPLADGRGPEAEEKGEGEAEDGEGAAGSGAGTDGVYGSLRTTTAGKSDLRGGASDKSSSHASAAAGAAACRDPASRKRNLPVIGVSSSSSRPRGDSRKLNPKNYAPSYRHGSKASSSQQCQAEASAAAPDGSAICDEILVQFEVLHSTRRHRTVEICLPASMHLSSLSDKVMSLDKWCISSSAASLLKEEEKEKRTKWVDGHPGGAPASGAELIGGVGSASSLVDACLIMAEGRLYCNRAALADESYKAQVSRFVKKGEAAGQLVHGEPLRMDECKLSDMNLELGASYIICHAGSCEHILRVTALRMHCCLDPGEWDAYPIILMRSRPTQRKCVTCGLLAAEYVSYGSHIVDSSPGFLCAGCHSRGHYGLQVGKHCPIRPEFARYFHD